ncbi:MAG: histidinol dehydrogenase [Candidatus Bathyarchaeota archaeon B24]|nr:MAG: histidinol dehydrogenase [Candidatus Bathyarchaeota archaeon B24]
MTVSPVRISGLTDADVRRLMARGLSLEEVRGSVARIIADVRSRGDEALLEYTRLYDKVELDRSRLKITREEMDDAYDSLDRKTREALETVHENVKTVCAKLLPEDRVIEPTEGVRIHVLWRPLERVGVYVPGGVNPYPSTVFMTATPAKVAGVDEVIACTPPGNARPEVLAAMKIAGVDRGFRVGGAQAIAAMAYGTETIPKVDKVVGPGGLYVEAAKRLVYGDVGLDLPAGPSEIAVLADDSADPALIAVDLLSQAEHPNSSALLVTTSERLALEVCKLLGEMAEPRLLESLKRGGVFIAEDVEEALNFLNLYAPEHLELFVENPEEVLSMVRNAGSVFLGPLTPAVLGDYATGVSHVLPTGGAARFSSGLTPLDFLKVLTVQRVDAEGFKTLRKAAERLAQVEGLRWHGEALRARRV